MFSQLSPADLLLDGTVPSTMFLLDGTVLSTKFVLDGTVLSTKFLLDNTLPAYNSDHIILFSHSIYL